VEDVVQWSRIFNVNRAANRLILEQNEKRLDCCGGEKMDPEVVTISSVIQLMYY